MYEFSRKAPISPPSVRLPSRLGIYRCLTSIDSGDCFGILPSALATMRLFPRMKEQFERESYDVLFSFWSYKGHKLLDLGDAEWNRPGVMHVARGVHVPWIERRFSVVKMLEAQCQRLGIQIIHGKAVAEYDEDETKAIVKTADGEPMHADVVVAADGVGTKSHKHVTGQVLKPESSGYAVFRGMIPIDILNDRLSEATKAKFLSEPRGEFRIYGGSDMHMNVILTRDFFCYIITHKDDGGAEESWNHVVSVDAVLDVVRGLPGWDPDLLHILSLTPENGVLDWKLLWRDPQPQWASTGGRVIQLGDSAHSFLPTSGNGATQAMEDGLSLATCLRLGGKANIPISTKAHVKLRYQRVSTLQRMGFATRQNLHHLDLEALEKDPSTFKMRHGSWSWGHDALQYAKDRFELAVKSVENGSELENSNLPEGHVYEEWTIEKEMERERAGKDTTLWDTGKWF